MSQGQGSTQKPNPYQENEICNYTTTVNPQKRPAGLILSLRVQMQVLLEFGPNLGIFAYCFLNLLRVLLEFGSYSRAGLFRGFTVC